MLEQAIQDLRVEVQRLSEAVQRLNALLARSPDALAHGAASTGAPAPGRATQADEALDERAVAKLLGVSVALVRRWRHQKTGPTFRKFGRLVRYRRKELMDWLNTVPRGGESR